MPARTPNMLLIPQGYTGWIRVDYDIKSAPPLPKGGGYVIYKIPPSGYLRTSSLPVNGVAIDKFYYVKGSLKMLLNVDQGASCLIWGGGDFSTGDGHSMNALGYCFFVGTRAQYKAPGTYGAQIGPLPAIAFQARIKGQNLSERNWNGHNFAGANLVGSNLDSSSLVDANLHNANLSYAVIRGDCTGANLRGANCSGAVMFGDFINADLRGANLRKAQLQGADLTHARLQGADLRGAEYAADTKWPHGFNPRAHGAVVKTGLYDLVP